MSKLPLAVFYSLLIVAFVGACASTPQTVVPDTRPGDQILDDYMVGKWCTNREQTATSNQAAGFSGLLNVSPVFWRFGAEGEWEASTSGFMYQPMGGWDIVGPDNLKLSRNGVEPRTYTAMFKDDGEGPNLYLTDEKGQFTVLSRCK